MKKILLLGAGGMLGHVLYEYLLSLNRYEISLTVHNNIVYNNAIVLDVTDNVKLNKIIREVKPDYVINCIGALLNLSKENIPLAIHLNAYLPHKLSELSYKYTFKLIHISTDCVFSGLKGQYIETDKKDAIDIYGISKGLGELRDSKNITLRTSIIGPELKKNGEGLFHWFLNQDKDKVSGYTEMIWGGVTTLELARIIDLIISDKRGYKGLYNITNETEISKFELLEFINNIWSVNLEIEKVEGKKVNKSLKTTRYDKCFSVKTYSEMLEDLYLWMVNNENIYQDLYNLRIGK